MLVLRKPIRGKFLLISKYIILQLIHNFSTGWNPICGVIYMHAMGEGDMVLYFKQAKAEFVPSLSFVEVEDEVGV